MFIYAIVGNPQNKKDVSYKGTPCQLGIKLQEA